MTQSKWCRFNVVMPKAAFNILFLAYQDIERQIPLHSEESIAWGRVIELLAADYLAGKFGRKVKTEKVTPPH